MYVCFPHLQGLSSGFSWEWCVVVCCFYYDVWLFFGGKYNDIWCIDQIFAGQDSVGEEFLSNFERFSSTLSDFEGLKNHWFCFELLRKLVILGFVKAVFGGLEMDNYWWKCLFLRIWNKTWLVCALIISDLWLWPFQRFSVTVIFWLTSIIRNFIIYIIIY